MRLPLSLLLLALPLAARGLDAAQPLVAHFVEDRVLVDAPLAAGGHLRFFTDSGGGNATRLLQGATERLKLPTRAPSQAELDELGRVPPDTRLLVGPLPLAPSAFPPPPELALVVTNLIGLKDEPADSDGMLGNTWFAGHVWTWNYVAGTLALEPADWSPPTGAQVVPIGLRPADGDGPALAFARIEVTIAGTPTSMLLDTGATTILTPEAAQRLGGPRVRSTSMIVASVIAAWRQAHPEWRVIEHAQAGTDSRMIEVPDVRIAGFQVGPVWFTERPDYNFKSLMSRMTDQPILGAIGGNAFHTLTMTIDYPHARAAFARGKR